ncbi:MAG: PhzF family phenazine biosynthesis protein [Terriglobales bacterium]|jgi:trans-2,3-dihydro-3-hydroxyanthranilate isomerase
MPVLQYVHLDVFTNQPYAGNQLAVFLDAEGMDERQMQRIANEMALPETTFVFPPEGSGTDARVRIFTPSQELPMAGSPTVGTTFALAGAGRLRAGADKTVLGLGIGPTTVGLEWGQNGLRFAWMTQPIPTFGPIVTDVVAVAAALGIQPCDLAGGNLPVQVASSGVPFLYVALNSRAAVDAAAVERTRLCTLLRAVSLEELPVFLFSPEPADDGATVYSRMFAPVLGIPEDPGTGGASGPLGAYLLKYNAVSAKTASRLVSLQGVRMGRPSHIHIALSIRAGVLEEVRVGGEAVVVGKGTVPA